MQAILLVGLGGFLGSVARYGLASYVLQAAGPHRFPFGTFAVNLLGCLVAGLLAGCAERYEVIGPEARLFLFTGLLGGFTTFSAFGLEATNLIRRGDLGTAALYVSGSVSLGLIAVGLGFWVVSLLPR
jgi:CrcB protein